MNSLPWSPFLVLLLLLLFLLVRLFLLVEVQEGGLKSSVEDATAELHESDNPFSVSLTGSPRRVTLF